MANFQSNIIQLTCLKEKTQPSFFLYALNNIRIGVNESSFKTSKNVMQNSVNARRQNVGTQCVQCGNEFLKKYMCYYYKEHFQKLHNSYNYIIIHKFISSQFTIQ